MREENELLAPGHRACPGCGEVLAIRHLLRTLGPKVVVVSPTGCMEVVTTPYPETSWRVPWIHVAFENAAAVASGIEVALRLRGKEDVKVVAIAGDGGTADIGLQALSGMAERGHNVLYVCTDNEAYMNTGIQRSGTTPRFAWTTTTPIGVAKRGKEERKKDMVSIMAAHGIPYAATACVSFIGDFIAKVRKASSIKGPAYLHVLCPCPPGWRFDSSKTIEIGRLAVMTGMWILYEVENGKKRLTFRPEKRLPVSEYLKMQGRFRHLTEAEIAEIQKFVDESCGEWGI